MDIATAYERTWGFLPPRTCREMHAAGLFYSLRSPAALRLAVFEVYDAVTIARETPSFATASSPASSPSAATAAAIACSTPTPHRRHHPRPRLSPRRRWRHVCRAELRRVRLHARPRGRPPGASLRRRSRRRPSAHTRAPRPARPLAPPPLGPPRKGHARRRMADAPHLRRLAPARTRASPGSPRTSSSTFSPPIPERPPRSRPVTEPRDRWRASDEAHDPRACPSAPRDYIVILR